MPLSKRLQVMYLFKMLFRSDAWELCELISEGHNKVSKDATGELQRGIEYACGIPELLKGEYSHNAGPGIDTWSNHQPVVDFAGITPFNFLTMVPLTVARVRLVWRFRWLFVRVQTTDVLVSKIAEKAQHLNIEPETEPGLDMGALVNQAHLDRVVGYIAQGESVGAALRLDGRKHPLVESSTDYFLGTALSAPRLICRSR